MDSPLHAEATHVERRVLYLYTQDFPHTRQQKRHNKILRIVRAAPCFPYPRLRVGIESVLNLITGLQRRTLVKSKICGMAYTLHIEERLLLTLH